MNEALRGQGTIRDEPMMQTFSELHGKQNVLLLDRMHQLSGQLHQNFRPLKIK